MTTYHIKSGTFVYPFPWPKPTRRPVSNYLEGRMATTRLARFTHNDIVKFDDEQYESLKELVKRMLDKELQLFNYIYFKLPKNRWGIEVIAVGRDDCIITHG